MIHTAVHCKTTRREHFLSGRPKGAPTEGLRAPRCLRVRCASQMNRRRVDTPDSLDLEVLAHAQIVRQAFPPSSLQAEVARKVQACEVSSDSRKGELTWAGLEWPELDRLVRRISRDDAPVIEELDTERCVRQSLDHTSLRTLALRVRSQIRLEAVGVDDRDKGLDSEERRSRLGNVLRHVPSSPREHLVYGRDAIRRRLNLDIVDGFHQPRRRSEHGGVADSSRSRNDLTTAAMYRLGRNRRIE